MKNYKIKNAVAEYTGGGCYVYFGELENGLWFKGSDNWDSLAICDADTSTEESDEEYFYESHLIEDIEGEDYKVFFNEVLQWIIDNAPKGNYQAYELEGRFLVTQLTERMFNTPNSIELNDEGYVYISEKGIKYELLEGVSIGSKQQFTSDLLFITLLDADYNVNDLVVGYLFGACIFRDSPNEYLDSIKRLVDEYESKNFSEVGTI